MQSRSKEGESAEAKHAVRFLDQRETGRVASDRPENPLYPEGRWPDAIRKAPWRRWTVSARVRPSLLIIGTQKGGTTALFRYMRMHPHFVAPLRKEIHYFDYFHDRGPTWYRAHFPMRRRASCVTGEASPYYLVHPLAPQRVAGFDPDMKLIAILRDPVERALSHHAMAMRRGHESLSFEAAVEAEGRRTQGCEEALRNSPYYYHHGASHYSYLTRGRYAEQLEAWLKVFPRKNLLILKSEDLIADANRLMNRVFTFVGLQPCRLPTGRFEKLRSYQVDSDLRNRLDRYFEPDQARLQAFHDNSWNEEGCAP